MSTEAEEIPSYESTKVVFLALFIYSPKAKNFISSKKQLLPLYSTCRLHVRVPSKVRKYYLRRYFRTFVLSYTTRVTCTRTAVPSKVLSKVLSKVHSYIHDHTRTRTVVYEDTFESTSGSTGTLQLQYFRKYFRTLHSSPTVQRSLLFRARAYEVKNLPFFSGTTTLYTYCTCTVRR